MMTTTESKIMQLAVAHLPDLDGVPVSRLTTVRVVETRCLGLHECCNENRQHVVAFTGHPDYGDEEVLGYLTYEKGKLNAYWGYSAAECNGVVYPTRRKANQVRAALAAAGIPHNHPASPAGKKALRAAGL